jgi:N-acetylmuramoyl-L-alanine amidase
MPMTKPEICPSDLRIWLAVAFVLCLGGFPAVATEAPKSAPAPYIARLGHIPDWSELDVYQGSLAREEFVYLLDHCYAHAPKDYQQVIHIEADRALILRQSNFPEGGYYELRFREGAPLSLESPKFWRTPTELPDLPPNSPKPLQGLRIAIDPGHIGGKWVTWDDRHYIIGKDTISVNEGEMTLLVAKILERDLSLLGATVILTRPELEPVTHERIETLRDDARSYLISRKQVPSSGLIESTAKAMFAISSEIRARSDLLNASIQPDLALCLHFNATPWPNPRRPSFLSPNHLHVLVNGCYSADEMREDDTRFEMVLRILQRVYYEELKLADALSTSLQKESRLPSVGYDGTNGMAVNDNDLVWARNLLANRVFSCPVVFFEPYCMNNREVYGRVQEGPYDALREVGNRYKKNLYQEYADGITAGLVRYYRAHR